MEEGRRRGFLSPGSARLLRVIEEERDGHTEDPALRISFTKWITGLANSSTSTLSTREKKMYFQSVRKSAAGGVEHEGKFIKLVVEQTVLYSAMGGIRVI